MQLLNKGGKMNTREDTAYILTQLGYEVDRYFRFKLRDEKTASASINLNGRIKDFGSGWYGSCVDLLCEFHKYSKKEAFDKVNEFMGVNNKQYALSEPSFKENKEHSSLSISEDYISNYELQRKENFTRYSELLKQTLPNIDNHKRIELAKKYQIGYSKESDRLIMPIRDLDNKAMTLWKYNPNPKPFVGSNKELIQLPKVMFSKGKKRCPFNLNDLNEYRTNLNKAILVVEGEKDCLNAIANGFRAITLGSATSLVEDKYIHLFKDTNITICYDYDDAGKNGAKALAEQLKNTCKKIEIFDWEQVSKQFKIELSKGFDFTDFMKITNEKKHNDKTKDRGN